MKKKIVALLALLMLGTAGAAAATPYSNTVDFKGAGTFLGQTYTTIDDSNSSNFVGNYSHTVTFDPAAASVQSGVLTLTFAYANELSGKDPKEVWFIDGEGGSKLGTLTAANDNLWHSQNFTLSQSLLAGVSGPSWTIGFKFNEDTNGTDSFYLDKSVISGDYTEVPSAPPSHDPDPVPEPGTMMLMGAGFLGLAIFGKRRKSA